MLVHPNTSGRVFYRVKPSPESKTTRSIFPLKKPQQPPKKKQKSNSGDDEDDNEEEEQNSNGSSDKEGGENHPGLDASGMDISENEDNEKGRITNLKGVFQVDNLDEILGTKQCLTYILKLFRSGTVSLCNG